MNVADDEAIGLSMDKICTSMAFLICTTTYIMYILADHSLFPNKGRGQKGNCLLSASEIAVVT